MKNSTDKKDTRTTEKQNRKKRVRRKVNATTRKECKKALKRKY